MQPTALTPLQILDQKSAPDNYTNNPYGLGALTSGLNGATTDSQGFLNKSPVAVLSAQPALDQINNQIQPAVTEANKALLTQQQQNADRLANANKPGFDAQGYPTTTLPLAPLPTPKTPEQQILDTPDDGMTFAYDRNGNRQEFPIGQIPTGFSEKNPTVAPTTPVADTAQSNLYTYKKYSDGTYGMFDNASGTYAGQATEQDFMDAKQARTDKERLDAINNGVYPLSNEEKAMIEGLRNTWQLAIDQQKTDNANLTGGMKSYINLTGGNSILSSGGIISSIIQKGSEKIASMNTQMAAAVAKMTRDLQNQDYERLKTSYDTYNALQKERNIVISKMHDDTQAVYKDKQTKIETAQNMADNDIRTAILEAKRGGATPEQIAEMDKALAKHDMSAAVNAAGDSLLTATGITGEYNAYKKDAQSRGLSVMSFDEYQTKDANRKARIAAAGVANGYSSAMMMKVLKVADDLKSEPTVKNYQVIAEGKQFMDNISNDTKNPADQQGIIYAFAKIMDPNSVVREGEYDTVRKYAQSWADTYGFNAKRIFSNSPFLTSEAIKNMKKTVIARTAASEKSYKNIYNETVSVINNITGGKDGSDYVKDYSKGFDSTIGDEHIQSEKQLSDKVFEFAKSHPALSPQMIQMEKDGTSMQDIFNWVNQQTK